ncbi:MAG: ABC transporter substrate-binding protein [Myxococcota bacterium]|nr:ABC transporter substrate-binding protein [Myxococcota bacterium]
MKDSLKRASSPILAAMMCAILWEDCVRLFQIPRYVLPAPSDIALILFADPSESAALFLGAQQTAYAAILGFLIATILGVASGTVLASVGVLKRGLYPLANLLQMVPIIALAPLLNIWFGYGISGVAASACIVAIFPIIACTVDGLGGVNPHHRDVFDLYGATPLQRWRLLGIQSALPQICTGLRVAAGLAVIGAVVGELVSGVLDSPPLGAIIAAALRNSALDLVFAAVFLSAAVGFSLFALVSLFAHMLLSPWHPSTRPVTNQHRTHQKTAVEQRAVLVFCVVVLGLTLYAFSGPDLRSNAIVNTSGSKGVKAIEVSQQRQVKIQLNWVPEPEFGGLYEAHLKGYFKDENLDVTLIKGGPGIATPQLVATGQVDFAIVSGSQVVTMRAQGAPLVAVYANFDRFVRGIVTRTQNAPDSLESLWTTSGPLAVEAGLPFVRWLNHRFGQTQRSLVQSGGSLTEFKRRPEMAQAVFVFAEPITLELDGIPTRVFPVSDSGFNPYSVVLATNERFLKENPQTVAAVQRALARGWDSYLADPKATNAELTKMNPAMSLRAMNLAAEKITPYVRGDSKRLGEMKLERWMQLIEQLKTIGVVENSPDPSRCFIGFELK